MRRAALVFLTVLGLAAEEPLHEMGPFPTREMFPLYLPTLAYQPVDPVPLGRGHWRWALNWMEANTFQFSDILAQESAMKDATGRLIITRAFVQANLAKWKDVPVLYFFDEEIARFELQGRFGLSDNTDLWFFLPVQNHTGGFLDPLIEGFHKLGFEQFGRDRVLQNQVTLVVAQYGKLVFYNDQRILGYWQSGYLHPRPYQEFDRPSLQHDLGVYWHWTPHTTLTFHYLNNITHNGNTADMGLGASLTAHF